MSAARVNHKQPVGSLVDPDAVLLLPLRIDAQRVITGKSNFEDSGGFEDCPWQKETQKH